GSGSSRTPRITLNMAVLAPIPAASVNTASNVNPGFFIRSRRANRKSCISPLIRPKTAKVNKTNPNAARHRRMLSLKRPPLFLLLAGTAFAQFPGLTLPPSGNNQKASVVQFIGPVRVSIDYSSPAVHSPQGQDRRGQIWG